MPVETRGQHLRSMGQKIKTRFFFRRMLPDRSIAATGTDKPAFTVWKSPRASLDNTGQPLPYHLKNNLNVRPIYLGRRNAHTTLYAGACPTNYFSICTVFKRKKMG